MTSLAERIERARQALVSEDDETLHGVLDGLVREGLARESVEGLLGLLSDDSDLLHQMYAVIHTIERSDPRVVYSAVVKEAMAVNEKAPDVLGLVIGRLLTARKDQGRGFDYEDFIATVASEGDSATKAKVLEVAQALKSRGKLGDDVIERAKNMPSR